MKLAYTFTVQVVAEETNGALLANALQAAAERLGEDVDVEETDASDIGEENE